MTRWGMLAAALLATAGAVVGAEPANAAAPGSRQAAYDAAQAAYDKGDWATAATGFAPLLPADAARPLNASQAVIAVRLAVALDRLGRPDAAAAAARRGVAAVPDSDTTTLTDGWVVIGDQARFALDVPAATAAYETALRYATAAGYETQRIVVAAGLGTMLSTIDTARAAIAIDALFADKALVGRLPKPTFAELCEIRARIALNAGDLPMAQGWINRALAATGGLTAKANQLQLAIRGDAAIVAQLRHDQDKAREYLTYTGAGHLDSLDWITAFGGNLPVCNAEGDLRPDDSAVVQVAIAPDGHVASAAPVYASRVGDVGMTFARSVRKWRWNEHGLAKVQPFWLASLRLEMRCEMRPDPQALGRPIAQDAARWLATHRDAIIPHDPAPGDVDKDGAGSLLDAARSGDAAALRGHAVDIADAPPSLRALAIFVDARAARTGTYREASHATARVLAASVPGFATRYPNTLALAWLRTEWALALEGAGDFGSALPLLGQVLATPQTVLADDDPIRQVATLHVAIARTRTGDAAGAQADLEAAGLNAAQCSLVDTRPIPTNLSVVSSQFPLEAIRWHFEGFARVSYDIGADGHVTGIRTVLAYPPFVFGPGTESAARSFRYAAPTLGGKVVGCQGESQTVSYRIPR